MKDIDNPETEHHLNPFSFMTDTDENELAAADGGCLDDDNHVLRFLLRKGTDAEECIVADLAQFLADAEVVGFTPTAPVALSFATACMETADLVRLGYATLQRAIAAAELRADLKFEEEVPHPGGDALNMESLVSIDGGPRVKIRNLKREEFKRYGQQLERLGEQQRRQAEGVNRLFTYRYECGSNVEPVRRATAGD